MRGKNRRKPTLKQENTVCNNKKKETVSVLVLLINNGRSGSGLEFRTSSSSQSVSGRQAANCPGGKVVGNLQKEVPSRKIRTGMNGFWPGRATFAAVPCDAAGRTTLKSSKTRRRNHSGRTREPTLTRPAQLLQKPEQTNRNRYRRQKEGISLRLRRKPNNNPTGFGAFVLSWPQFVCQSMNCDTKNQRRKTG